MSAYEPKYDGKIRFFQSENQSFRVAPITKFAKFTVFALCN